MVGKVGDKKKQLKTLVTFHSEAVFDRATAEPNTSALAEALFARHFGIEIDGDSIQAQQRKTVLSELPIHQPVSAVVSADAANTADEDRGGLTVPTFARASTPLASPVPETDEVDEVEEPETPIAAPTADTGVIVPAASTEPELIPDRPAEEVVQTTSAFGPAAQPVAAFAPAESTSQNTSPAAEEVQVEPPAPAPVEPAPAAEEAPIVETKPDTLYAPGTRICPSCGTDMGANPYCLVCL